MVPGAIPMVMYLLTINHVIVMLSSHIPCITQFQQCLDSSHGLGLESHPTSIVHVLIYGILFAVS